MKKKLYVALGFLLAFVLWTVLVCFVDVQAIGPRESSVGFATANNFVHQMFGVNMTLYVITDWLGLIPIVFMLGFAVVGLVQWIKRKSLLKVDYSLFVLGGFYFVVLCIYILFEFVVINRRPILIEGYLEASYPSSTTMLVMCVIPTTIMQLSSRIKNTSLKKWLIGLLGAFMVFMVVGRLISGVHWFSDIVGGALISTGLVLLYDYFVKFKRKV
jgi:undecaprenyl-diphosphatase